MPTLEELENRIKQLEQQVQLFQRTDPAIALGTNLFDIGYMESYHDTIGGNYTLTGAYADTGLTVTVDEAGDYLIFGVFDVSMIGDNAVTFDAICLVAGSALSEQATFKADVDERATVSQIWYATGVFAGDIIKIQAKKSAGGGTSALAATNTIIRVLNIN